MVKLGPNRNLNYSEDLIPVINKDIWICEDIFMLSRYDSALHKLLSDQISFHAFYADVSDEEGTFTNKN